MKMLEIIWMLRELTAQLRSLWIMTLEKIYSLL